MPHRRPSRAVPLAAAIAVAALAPIAAARAADITVAEPWSRAAIQGGVGGAFMRIENHGAVPDRLLSVSSPAARAVELHASVQDGDVARMRPVDRLEIPPHGTVRLQPGGLHIMLIGLHRPLKRGDEVPLSLAFEHAGTVSVRVVVQAAAAGGGHVHGGAAHASHR